MRLTHLVAIALSARLFAGCGDGNVTGENPPASDPPEGEMPIRQADGGDDGWSELVDDASGTKGNPDAARPASDASVDGRAGDASGDPCASHDDGTYCAGLVGLPTPGLLRCVAHLRASVTTCPSGCLDRPGATDVCLDDSIDPCFNELDGLFCGRTIGSPTRPNDAFRCMYHRTTWSSACAGGCAMGAAGVVCN